MENKGLKSTTEKLMMHRSIPLVRISNSQRELLITNGSLA